MVCSSTEPRPFYFRTFDPPYMSGEINPGLDTAVPVPGATYPGTVSINNDGIGVPTPIFPKASVKLWAVQPGTAPSSFPTPTESTTDVTGCTGASPGGGTASTTYTAPSWGTNSHYCLIAKVKNGIVGVANDYTNSWDINQKDDGYLRIAQRNVFVVAGGGDSGTPQARKMAFAFAIPNATPHATNARVVMRAIPDKDERWAKLIAEDPQLAPLLKFGKLAPVDNAGIAIGEERGLRGNVIKLQALRLARSLKVDLDEVLKGMPREGELGHVGPLSAEEVQSLVEVPAQPAQALRLSPRETRQGIVMIEAPKGATPGSFFGVDVRHEGASTEKPNDWRLIGGLVVFLRVPHPADSKQ